MGKTLQVYVLARAAEILGGAEALATRLGISQTSLKRYLESSEPLPPVLYLKVIDIFVEDQIASGGRARSNNGNARPKENGKGNGNNKGRKG